MLARNEGDSLHKQFRHVEAQIHGRPKPPDFACHPSRTEYRFPLRASTAEWAAKRRPTISTECSRATVPVPWPHHKFGVKPRSQLRTTPRPRGVEMGYLCSASSFDNMCIYTDRWLNRETGMKCLRHRDDAWSESCHCVQRHVSSTCIYDRQAKSCQLDVVWGTQCEAATDAASRRWTVCPRCALLKSRGLVPVDQVLGVEMTGLETRWLEWHRPTELPGQSRATACGDACQVRAIRLPSEIVPTRRRMGHAV